MENVLSTPKYQSLPAELQQQVKDFAEFLFYKYKRKEGMEMDRKNQKREMSKAGFMKGEIWMADDFNEPLEDFKEYMS